MKQPAMKSFSKPLSEFSVIMGSENEMKHLIDTAWLFAYSALWNNQAFSTLEKSEAKFYIKEWLTTGKKPVKAFTNFCQRVVLARQNIHAINTDLLSLPSLWLDNMNTDGYAMTKDLLDEVKAIRLSIPSFQIEIKALAEAALEFAEEPTNENFCYWRNYFIERNEPVLLNLYSVYCANQKFHIK